MKKINDYKYKYKNIDVRYRDGIFYTVIALQRYNNTPRVYEIEGGTQEEFIEAVNNCISTHMFLESKSI